MAIRYMLIDTDGVGSFGAEPDRYTTSWIDGLVGPEGWDRVPLSRNWRMSAFVNDCGHRIGLPRNIVGSALLCTFGAGQQPYAGPIVITGWDESATRRDQLEICTLQDPHVDELTKCLADVRRVLGLEAGPLSGRSPGGWADEVRRFAEDMRTVPAPQLTVVHGDVALAALLPSMLRALLDQPAVAYHPNDPNAPKAGEAS